MTTIESLPAGLRGVVVSDTAIGDVRGAEGYYHYRGRSAVELARTSTFDDAAALVLDGELPDEAGRARFRAELAERRELPDAVHAVLPTLAAAGRVRTPRRTARRPRDPGRGRRPRSASGARPRGPAVPTPCASSPPPRPSSPPSTACAAVWSPSARATTCTAPPHGSTCCTAPSPTRRPRPPSSTTSSPPSTTGSTPPPSPPGSRPRRAPTWRPPSSPRSAPSPARCTAAPRTAPSRRSTRSVRPTASTTTSGPSSRRATGSWGSGTRSTARPTRARSCCASVARGLRDRPGGEIVALAETLQERTEALLAEYRPGRDLRANVEFWAAW